jgi:ABC-type lipoprotein export system ATPase subunit
VVALRGLDLVVEEGELMAIVGASGSGKTSLMNILGGLDRPSAGRVWVGEYDLLKMSDAALNRYRRSEVGFVWQQGTRNLIPYLNTLENVQLPMTLAGQTGRKKRKRAEELLEIVGLGDRRHHRIEQLSGGEQQRVAIATALANSPRLLLADEPTGEVDSTTALTIYQTFRDLNRELNLTTMIVSHDPTIAHQVNRVVAIRDGQLASETLRQAVTTAQDNGHLGDEEAAQEVQHVFEELVVLDSAGRLQVPKEYLDQFNIKGRAQLEVVEGGILIKAAPQSAQRAVNESRIDELIPRPKAGALRKLWQRVRPGK